MEFELDAEEMRGLAAILAPVIERPGIFAAALTSEAVEVARTLMDRIPSELHPAGEDG